MTLSSDTTTPAKTTLPSQEVNWLVFGIILLATISSNVASVAYNQWQQTLPVIPVLLPSALFLSVLSAPCIYFGLRFSAALGLAPQSLFSVLTNKSTDNEKTLFWQNTIRAAILGVLVGAFFVALHFGINTFVSSGIPTFGSRGPVGGFLVSLRAAIGEEVWFRLGVMTAAVWAVSKLANQEKPSNVLVWGVILIAAFLFAMSHIPQLNEYETMTSLAVWGTVIGNCAVGTLYGWCYWRYSLFAAMVAHFSVDIVIHVIPAFFL